MENFMQGESGGMPVEYQSKMQNISRQLKIADALRAQSQQMPQGQMVSGHYVAPHFTQYLAQALKGYNANASERDAEKKQTALYTDYQSKQNNASQALIDGLRGQEVQTGTNTTMPAYQPEQMDSFGSPQQGAERTPITTPVMTRQAPTPEQIQALQLKYAQDTGNYGQIGQVANQMATHAINRADKVDDRNYQTQSEERTYSRNRADKLTDVEATQKYDDIVRKDTQGFQISQQDRQFAQQYQMQKQSQGFQAGQQSRSQAFQAGENQKNRNVKDLSPTAVIGADGNPVYVAKGDAIGKKPYSAKQEAQDALKVSQNEQAKISAQQALDQSDLLFNHVGRKSGTGLSHYASMIPATDAKDFKANLDTFKAQTFVPMVSALKGMGALSDAEGKKLTESVGALDPSMSEEAFAASLKTVTKTLYAKAKASGLNVSLPSFAQERAADKQPNNAVSVDY